MTLHETIDSRTRISRTALPTGVVLTIRSKGLRVEASDVLSPCACSNRAKIGLPSVRKPPSRTSRVCAAGTAPPGGSPPDWTRELYHDVKWLSNLCYDWSSPPFEMLRFLSIRRLAVIDSVEVEFGPGLNVLTGETGAGKSMLVEAVGLLLGGRASAELVRTGEDTANIEAIFETSGQHELMVRREVTAQGRSRAFIDGDLATVGALKDLSARLIELHGQHEHQTLLDPSTHLAVLDAFAGLDALVEPTRGAFDSLQIVASELARVRRAAAEREARQDLVGFQLAELDRVRPVLASAERVERLCEESYASLYERDDAILARLGGVWRRVTELAALDPRF